MSLKELQLPSIASLRAIAALKSPHLALVRPARIGLGFESAGGNQKTLLEIEEVLGGPGRLSLPYSLRWLLDALTGLGVLHRTLGFVHGEVQPEHVVLGDDGVGRLIPVVRAHWVRGEARARERLYYLAPEKLLGDRVDVRSDVFSVGVLLWEALQGQRLLEAYEVDDIIARLMGGGIPKPTVPEGEGWTLPLIAIAERAIAVDPSRRFASVAELKDAIESACHRYVASTPGMVELFKHPERRARSHVRESLAPDSQRATLPPMLVDHRSVVAASAVDEAALEQAAERLSRSSYASVDLEEELTTRPNAAQKPSHEALPVARAQRHVNTLMGVPPPQLEQRESYAPDSVTTPFVRAPSVAPRFVPAAPLAHQVQPSPRVVEPALAQRSPSPPLEAARSAPPQSASPTSRAPAASLSPLVKRAPAPVSVEPSFELLRPRKRRGPLWLAIGAVAAVGLFAARPWLSRQVAATDGAATDGLPPNATPPSAVTTSASATTSPTPPAPVSIPERLPVSIASTPPSPSSRLRGNAASGMSRDAHVVIRDSVDATYPQPVSAVPVPEPDPSPPSKAEPAPAPEAPPPPAASPTSVPRQRAAPVSDADRYGI